MSAFSPPALGFGFGEPVVSSALGQPLRMRIPLRVDPELEITPQCVRLLGNSGIDAIPTMTMAMARISIERKGEARVLRIDSLYPINEPVMRVEVEAGCAQHARREFMLLLDPPDALPQMALTAPVADAPAAPVVPAPVATPAAAPASAGSTTGSADVRTDTSGANAATGTNPPLAIADADLALGGATITGRVGEALAMQIAVTGSAAATLDPACVHLAGAWNGEGAPVLSQASLNLVHTGADTLIDLRTANPVTEPALRVIVEAGCGLAVRREYAVLLDKPAAANGAVVAAAQPPIPAPATMPNAGAAAVAAGSAAAPAAIAPPAKPKPPRKIFHRPAAPATLATTPDQAAPKSTASAAANALADTKPAPAAKPKPPVAGTDRLVLAAPVDQPDPAAARLAEMDKRIADLTKEITQLRGELVTERQRAAEAEQAKESLSAGWIVAILALLGLGLGGLMSWQRKRSGVPWEKSNWEPPVAAVPADAPAAATAAVAPQAPAPRVPLSAPPLPTAPYRPAARDASALPPRRAAPPSSSTLANFEELTGTGSTLTPGAGGPKSTIEVTELHADDPELEKMHTVFLEPGNLDGPVFTTSLPVGAMNTRIPGPRPVPGAGPPRDNLGKPTTPSPITQLPPISDMAPMPAPTIVAPDQRHGAFSFDEGPYTQTPTMLVLDLDLTTRILPLDDAQAAKSAAAPKGSKDGKDGEGVGGAKESPQGHKNGR